MPQLSKKHRRVLALLKTNRLSIEEIAKEVGFSREYVDDLIEATPNLGELGQLFQTELAKVDKFVDRRTNRKMLKVRELLYTKLHQWVKSIKDISNSSVTERKQLIDSINALNKAYPQIHIEQYTWKEGMSTEEVLNEFRRLTAMAEKATIRRRVSGAGIGRSEQIPLSSEQVDESAKDTQVAVLPAKRSTEEIPSE